MPRFCFINEKKRTGGGHNFISPKLTFAGLMLLIKSFGIQVGSFESLVWLAASIVGANQLVKFLKVTGRS